MYLKSIEMQGFKSFADKILLEFNEGVTGIVGPNGSGKSNVADAVRWVLGEQSAKQLRGANMQDVIFSGTENRKPVSYAYVALTLDNSDRALSVDYDEVKVSRRVYRSGESEYILNGSSCRLKDILELFYDTGIGKEGYSIIGQGQIDKILSGKPEDRRELFDEAAGIVKYKKRKIIAEKRLENEHLNFLRVQDILNELEKQVGPLARQSEKAKQFLGYRERAKEYDLQMFCLNEKQNEKKSADVSEKREVATAQLEEVRAKTESLKDEFDALQLKMQEQEEEISRLNEQKAGQNLDIEKKEGSIRLLKEQQRQMDTDREASAKQLEQIKASREEKKATEDAWRKEQEELAKKAQTFLDSRDTQNTSLLDLGQDIQALDGRISSIQNEVYSLMNEKTSLSAKHQRFQTMLEQSAERAEEIRSRIFQSQNEEEKQSAQKQELEAKSEEILQNQKERREQEAELTRKEQDAVARREEIRSRVARSGQNYQRSLSQWESMRNIAERYEGFGNSTRRIMEQRNRFPGVMGPVSDLIRTEKQYEVAVETALGGSIQNIVTDDEQTAKRCIEFLKENKYGRSTFLPLDSIVPKEFQNARALQEKGVIGTGSSLLSAREGLEKLPDYLLGNVLVVDTMDHALAIARKYHYDFRIVTLDGELFNRGGSITGGAFKSNSNLLGRKRELEELEKQKNRCAREEQEAKADLETVSAELKAIRETRDGVRNELLQYEISIRETQMAVQTLKEREEERNAGFQDLHSELKRLEGQTEQVRTMLADCTGQESRIDGDLVRKNEELDAQKGERQKLADRQDELREKMQETNVELAEMTQRNRALKENRERLAEELEQLDIQEEACLRAMQGFASGQEEKQESIKSLQKEIEDIRIDLARTEEQLESVSALRKENQARQSRFMSERDTLASQATDLEKEIYRLDHQQEKIDETVESAATYLWNEYELTPSEARSQAKDTGLSLPQIRKELQEIRTAIKNLGPVNVNAIEEYKEVSSRYTDMKGQYEDLQKAEESLKKIILDLEQGMRAQFTEKFAQIRLEFNRVFRELFGGGKAELELADPENVLESGILITAQPPGKKLVNMMQMSGGEKALTAISILFAIQNLKPSPFCLLDEIEAALDDANVGRYADYLKKLSVHTQFITITHRRGTMLAADRLYGITMQEKGVSALVSVNLADA